MNKFAIIMLKVMGFTVPTFSAISNSIYRVLSSCCSISSNSTTTTSIYLFLVFAVISFQVS